MTCRCLLLSFVFFVTVFAAAEENDCMHDYKVPKPIIEAFKPHGLRVSIPDCTGVTLFAFHGNINIPMDGLEAGKMSKDILQKTGGRWVFRDKTVNVNVGDTVHYWLFVIRHGLGYRYDNGVYTITEITPGTLDETETTDNPQPSSQTDRNETTTIDSCNAQTEVKQVCEGTLVDLTKNLINLQNELSSARQDVATLRQIVEKDSEASVVLKLDGRLPDGEEPLPTVQKIIRETLQLPITVKRAFKNTDNSVTFEVNSLTDKLSIAREAETKLKNSGIFITV